MPFFARGDYIAIAQLVAGIIDTHIMCQTGSDQCEGCCPECCAPCAGLRHIRDNMDWMLTSGLTMWAQQSRRECIARFPDDDWDFPLSHHDWEMPQGGVNWPLIEAHWKMKECHGEQ